VSAPAETDRQQLARVLRFARQEGWTSHLGTWSNGYAEVTWDAKDQLLSVVRTPPFSDRRAGADIEVASIREALDVLAALNMLPLIFAPAYKDGDRSGAARTERVLHEHYNRHHTDVVHELDDMIVALGAFVDREHEWKTDAGCRPTPGVDCADGCEACRLLADLYDEHRAAIAAELRGQGYDR
jgi:hypothetical protein